MASRQFRIGVVGATGLVGTEFVKLLEERKTPVQELRLFASAKSSGRKIGFRKEKLPVHVLEPGCFTDLDVVFFSAGGSISKEWAPRAVEAGAYAIDNSSCFRMNPEVNLVVPEVNGDLLTKDNPQLIANPNCSTIQMVLALAPLQKAFGLEEVRVSTYQATSGAGIDAQEELKSHSIHFLNNTEVEAKNFPESIAFNNIPQIGEIEADGFTTEERKMILETNKILRDEKLRVSAFCVRTPTINGHSESLWATLTKAVDEQQVVDVLTKAPGVEVNLGTKGRDYTSNRACSDRDPVYIGRIHRDFYDPKTWLMWVSADNIRKGAALNGLQIAERIFDIQ